MPDLPICGQFLAYAVASATFGIALKQLAVGIKMFVELFFLVLEKGRRGS